MHEKSGENIVKKKRRRMMLLIIYRFFLTFSLLRTLSKQILLETTIYLVLFMHYTAIQSLQKNKKKRERNVERQTVLIFIWQQV